MSDTLPERPTFISGQYIGADDLNAAVDYARDETRRLALSARTWGIGTGLALVRKCRRRDRQHRCSSVPASPGTAMAAPWSCCPPRR